MPTLQQIQANNMKQRVSGNFAIFRKKEHKRTPRLVGSSGPAPALVDPMKTLGHPPRGRKKRKK